MALLAAPIEAAICIDGRDVAGLEEKSTVILDALRRIRKIESPKGDSGRLHSLDSRIQVLQDTDGQNNA